jgi:small-conductance mechanosensitive channel
MFEVLEIRAFGNPLAAWAAAAGIVLGVVGFTATIRSALLRYLRPIEDGTELDWQAVLSELARRTLLLVALIVGLCAASRVLRLPLPLERSLGSIFIVAIFVQVALWADQLLTTGTEWQLARRRATAAATRNALGIIRFLLRVAVWAIALLLILSNLGFDVTALVAGLGIGGVAVALAAQNILSDLFASIAIVLDRPFEVGDVIAFEDQQGRVERIGIKTTRIRSLSGEQIACANTRLLAARIHNFQRMSERRVAFSLGVAYETPVETVAKVPELLRGIIGEQENVRFDRAHFKAYGNNWLVFEVVYWVIGRSFGTYMDAQEAINLAILRRFGAAGIAFAHPDRAPTLPPTAVRSEVIAPKDAERDAELAGPPERHKAKAGA